MKPTPHEARSHGYVYGYARSSQSRPRAAADLIDPQCRAIDAWAARSRLAIAEILVERGSASHTPLFDRPQGKDLLARLRPGDTLVVARFDRLFGTPEDAYAGLLKARRLGFHVHALDVENGRLRLEKSRSLSAVLLAVAARTPDAVSFRAMAVSSREAARRRYGGGHVPFGYRLADGNRLVDDEAEQAFILELLAMKKRCVSLDAMATISRARNIRIRTAAGIGKVLKRRFMEAQLAPV